jgi:hypothetical protein
MRWSHIRRDFLADLYAYFTGFTGAANLPAFSARKALMRWSHIRRDFLADLYAYFTGFTGTTNLPAFSARKALMRWSTYDATFSRISMPIESLSANFSPCRSHRFMRP